ncbi:MAG TPA: CbiX/SirB N-terminal domain-containing protein [Candidatus Methylacidiphilales bacterium]|jgi:sirohydrochlorin cobaltochelatase|nr:CbiX/SirB N-terminal domain-containing protein [Candidatus Methylacidiphilales bacterium]
MPLRDAALLLLGHGSTLNADSSAPTYQHAEEIARRGVFAEVHVAFWKEEPNFRQALRQTRRRQVYVVPNFISSGYFTEQIIPRELELDGPVTRLDGREIFYCQPVGLNREMTEALLKRAGAVVAASAEKIPDPAKTACLFICGHGTSLNDNSTKIIHEQAEIIRARGLYADCQAVLMEQRPFVKDWRALTGCPDVIVVPFFISDGLHSFEDIPVLLGLTHNIKERGFTNPHREKGRRLWYSTAVGTEASLADVILAQVRQFQAEHPGTNTAADDEALPALSDELALFLKTPGPSLIGDVAIRTTKEGTFELMHGDDLDLESERLRRLHTLGDLRELIRLDDSGHFRPLRAAPNLRRGWIYHAADSAEAQAALDYLYPSAVANWALWLRQKLSVTPWTETAERQTGRFRIVREIDEAATGELVEHVCRPGCLKQRLWPPAAQPVETPPHEIPLLCPEACNFLVSKARTKLKGTEKE